MFESMTFGRRLALAFGVMSVITLAISATAIITLSHVVESKDRVIQVDAPTLVKAMQMRTERARLGSNIRTYLLTGADADYKALMDTQKGYDAIIEDLRSGAGDERRQALDAITSAENDYRAAVDRVVAVRRSGADADTVAREFASETEPLRGALSSALDNYTTFQQQRMEDARARSSQDAAFATTLIGIVSAIAILVAIVVATYLTRTLGRQIGLAVGQVQSSSAELQAAATQQASGIREQATSMAEITTTISELLATAKQIAESARRVAEIAEETASSAEEGDGTIGGAHDSIAMIRRQVDMIVNHMLALGKKSQEIGAVLDIVSELAEQTNILSINATIEAAGAGESGRRFAVVADEIRKLADRVAESAKEIRSLIDDIRSSVNTTVMATETGSKAVDAGSQQFGDVATAFKSIARLVTTTTEAAREIELSTKQQSTAVEQVNIAIASVAQAAKESEVSTGQTLQTAAQLAGLSGDLLKLVQRRAA